MIVSGGEEDLAIYQMRGQESVPGSISVMLGLFESHLQGIDP